MEETNFEKQQLLVDYLRKDQETFIRMNPIISAKFFEPRLQGAVKFIQSYFNDYKSLPSIPQLSAESGVVFSNDVPLTKQERKYAEAELEAFCKHKAMEHAIYESVDLIKEGKYGDVEKLIKDAVTLSVHRSLGIDYFEDPESRLNLLKMTNSLIPTKIHKLDKALGGGLNRREMIVFAAPSGVGKSITMLNVAFNLMSQGYNGVYITLELSEEVVSKRADSITSGLSQEVVLEDTVRTAIAVKKLRDEQGYGKLAIKRMPESSTNANNIRAYLKEYELAHGILPDFIVVDYIDIMASCQQVSVENQFIKDKYVCEELRAIANDLNSILITASQLNRGAQEVNNLEDLNQAHIAGGISKINTTDNLVMIIQTQQMKARGEMVFKLVKTRSSSGVGQYFTLKFSPISLRLTNLEEDVKPTKFDGAISAFNKTSRPKAANLEASLFQV
jgi:archaellum biogenesis ATPase FlaH